MKKRIAIAIVIAFIIPFIFYIISFILMQTQYFSPTVSFDGNVYEVCLESNVVNDLNANIRQLCVDDGYLVNISPIWLVFYDGNKEEKIFLEQNKFKIIYNNGYQNGLNLLEFDKDATLHYGGQHRMCDNILISENEITFDANTPILLHNEKTNSYPSYIRPGFAIEEITDEDYSALISAKKIYVNQSETANDEYTVVIDGNNTNYNMDFFIVSADETADVVLNLYVEESCTTYINNFLDFQAQADNVKLFTADKAELILAGNNEPQKIDAPFLDMTFNRINQEKSYVESVVDIKMNKSENKEYETDFLNFDNQYKYNCKYYGKANNIYVGDKTLNPNFVQYLLYNNLHITVAVLSAIISVLLGVFMEKIFNRTKNGGNISEKNN